MTDSVSHRSQRPNSDDASCEVFETGGRIYAYTYSGKLIRTAIFFEWLGDHSGKLDRSAVPSTDHQRSMERCHRDTSPSTQPLDGDHVQRRFHDSR